MKKTDHDNSKLVPVTQEMIDKLLELKKKTGVGYHALYKYGKSHTNHNVFVETTEILLNIWANGKSKTVNIDHYNSIIDTYENIPQRHKGGWKLNDIPVTDELRLQLKTFVDKPKNLSIKKILQYSDSPDKLSPTDISNIINGRTMNIRQDHLDFLNQLITAKN